MTELDSRVTLEVLEEGHKDLNTSRNQKSRHTLIKQPDQLEVTDLSALPFKHFPFFLRSDT